MRPACCLRFDHGLKVRTDAFGCAWKGVGFHPGLLRRGIAGAHQQARDQPGAGAAQVLVHRLDRAARGGDIGGSDAVVDVQLAHRCSATPGDQAVASASSGTG
jgi:hypothetical protein